MTFFHPFQGRLTRRYLLMLAGLSLLPAIAIFAIPVLFRLKAESSAYVSYLELLLLISAGFILILALAGWLTFLWLVKPLQELARGAHQLAEGQYTHRIQVNQTNDEISELAVAFNAMAQSIQENQIACLSEQEALQAMLARREAEFGVIAQVAGLMNNPPDLPAHLSTALGLAGKVLGTDFLAVFLRSESGDYVFTSAYSREPIALEPFRQHCKEQVDLPLFELATQSHDWVRIPDVHDSDIPLAPAQLEGYQRLQVNRLGVKPIVINERVLGVIFLMRHQTDYIPIPQITFMDTFSNHLALIIVSNQLKTQARDLVIMEERRRLASELHDSVTQSLFSLGMATQSLVNYLGDVSGPAHSAIRLIEAQTRIIQSELRTLINELRPLNLRAEEGLDYALKRHINSLRQNLNAEVSLRIDGDPRRLPLPVQQTLNRIAQEALSNIARHSHASRVEVTLTIAADEACLELRDNGVGFTRREAQAQMYRSYGLTSMRDRVEFIGGSLELKTAPGEGVQIIVRVPLEEKAEAADG